VTTRLLPSKDPRIEGVHVRDLRWIPDARGSILECWRESWGVHDGCRQVYLSETLPGTCKAFHSHRIQTDVFLCAAGRVLLVLFDEREGSATRGVLAEYVLSPDRGPRAVSIPPGVVHGWKAISEAPAIVLNAVSREYDGTDEYRRPADSPCDGGFYEWHGRRDG
jgi:dTDP-4-dehydrorhamnose 3,5-epimerase